MRGRARVLLLIAVTLPSSLAPLGDLHSQGAVSGRLATGFSVSNGGIPFAGDHRLLTTISPNGRSRGRP